MDNVKKVRASFPLALKLSLVVSAILVVSLGIIIFSVWFFIRLETAKTAAADNDSINFRVAAAAESMLKEIREETILLLCGAYATGEGRVHEELASYYFEHKPDIAAVVSVSPSGKAETMINDVFIHTNEINDFLIIEYLNMKGIGLLQGDTSPLLVNAAPDFYGLPILVARFPYTEGTSLNLAPSVAIVFFSSRVLADYLSAGASQSYLLSNSGELLIQNGDLSAGNFVSNPALNRLYSGNTNHVVTSYSEGGSFLKGDTVFASIRRVDFDAALLTLIPGSVVFEGINATTRRNLYLALSVWFISILFFSIFSSRLTQQLRILTEAAEAMEDGWYRRLIPGKAHDETGFLTMRLNSLRNTLYNFESFTNKQIARLTRKGILAPGGVTRNAVFLFSDIRSFTAISENMDPSHLVSFLNDYMDRMVSCIMMTGGIIDKFIGDAILAHWGAVASDDNAEGLTPEDIDKANLHAALRAVLLMRASLYCFNNGKEGENHPQVKFGCGISSGKVAAGLIGNDERLVYTVIGKAVNIAEKMESANKSCGTETLIASHAAKTPEEDFIIQEMPGSGNSSMKYLALINVKSEEETKRLLAELGKFRNMDKEMALRCIGPGGPQTLPELRELLGISEVNLSKVVLNEREKKFKVQKS